MDIEKLKAEFEQSECFKRLEHVAQYTFFEFGAYIKRTDVPADIEKKCGKLITALLFSWSTWKEAKAQAVPDLGELQERIAGHQYYHDEHGHMIVDMDDVVKEISGFDSWKAQAVPEGFVLVEKPLLSDIHESCVACLEIVSDKSIYKSLLMTIRDEVAPLIEAQEPANADTSS